MLSGRCSSSNFTRHQKSTFTAFNLSTICSVLTLGVNYYPSVFSGHVVDYCLRGRGRFICLPLLNNTVNIDGRLYQKQTH